MAIWFELLVMLLATYTLGIVIGWVLWGRDITAKIGTTPNADSQKTDEETF